MEYLYDFELTFGRFVVANLELFQIGSFILAVAYAISYLCVIALVLFRGRKCRICYNNYIINTNSKDFIIQAILSLLQFYVSTFEKTRAFSKLFALFIAIFAISIAAWEKLFGNPLRKFLLLHRYDFMKVLSFLFLFFLEYNVVITFFLYSKFDRAWCAYGTLLGGAMALTHLFMKESLDPLFIDNDSLEDNPHIPATTDEKKAA